MTATNTHAAHDLAVVHVGPVAGGGVACKPLDYLDRSQFQRYIGACRSCGGTFVPALKSQVTAPDRLADLVAALKDADFAIQLDPSIAESLQATIAKVRGEADAMRATVDELTASLDARELRLWNFQLEGVAWLRSRTAGILADDMGLGKAQPLDAKVLTPTGWTRMGDLGVGDYVMTVGGGITHVTGVYPQGEREVYRVTFSDGASTECCDEHLWLVSSPTRKARGQAGKVMPLAEIRAALTDAAGNARHYVPIAAPMRFVCPESALPVDPYLLGVLLGDGSTLQTVKLSSADAGVLNEVRRRLPAALAVKRTNRDSRPCDYAIAGRDGRIVRNVVARGLKQIGAFGHRANTKRVPQLYLFAPVQTRLDVLRGLMDTDGSIAKNGVVEFSSASRGLAEDVRFLVQSLGGVARLSAPQRSTYRHRGAAREGLPRHRLIIAMPREMNPFLLPRKADAWKPRVKYQPTRAIVSVELVGVKAVQCIAVAALEHLYVTDDCIVTHNTVQGLMAIPAGAPVLVICPASLKGNWVREANTWRKDLYPSILNGRHSFRFPLPNEIVVTNYDILPEAMARSPRPGTILIADEAHAVKSGKAHRSKRFRALARAVLAGGGRVWPMTGTPILNRPIELWTLLQHIGCADEAFGGWSEFKRMFGAQKTSYGMEWGEPRHEAAAAIRKVCLRRRRTEVLPDLPTKTHVDLPVEIDDTARAIADEVVEKLRAAGISLEDALQATKLPVVFELMSKLRAAVATAMIPAMLDVVEQVEETGEAHVVFSAHRAPIDLLATRPGWAVITGDTAPEQRSRIVHDFQTGRLRGIALTIKAGGVGLTLTKAHQALFVDLEWTPALNCQAEDRICRIGQDRGCIIRRLIGRHEIVEIVAEKLIEKQRLIDGSVEQAAVREGGHTSTIDAATAKLESVLASVTTVAAVPEGHVRRAPVVVIQPRTAPAPIAAADNCPF
jgi:hypothetical protein